MDLLYSDSGSEPRAHDDTRRSNHHRASLWPQHYPAMLGSSDDDEAPGPELYEDDEPFGERIDRREAQAWRQPTYSGEGYSTELIEFQAAHHEQSYLGWERIALYRRVRGAPVQPEKTFRWMHVRTQANGSPIAIFQRLVETCPDHLPGAAQRLFTSAGELNPVKRASRDVDPNRVFAKNRNVALLSAPFNHLLRGTLCVSSIWILLLGSDAMLTASELPWREIGSSLIDLMPAPSGEFCIISCTTPKDSRHHSHGHKPGQPVHRGDRNRRTRQGPFSVPLRNGNESLYSERERPSRRKRYEIVVRTPCPFVNLLRDISLATSIKVDGRNSSIQSDSLGDVTAEEWLRANRGHYSNNLSFQVRHQPAIYHELVTSRSSPDALFDSTGSNRDQSEQWSGSEQGSKSPHPRPFFTWRTSNRLEQTIDSVTSVLDRVHLSLMSRNSHDFVAQYSHGSRCTHDEMVHKNPHILDTRQIPQDGERIGTYIVAKLAKEAQRCFSCFVPAESSSEMHVVCQSFWGAIDDLPRQMNSLSRTVPSKVLAEAESDLQPCVNSLECITSQLSRIHAALCSIGALVQDPLVSAGAHVEWHLPALPSSLVLAFQNIVKAAILLPEAVSMFSRVGYGPGQRSPPDPTETLSESFSSSGQALDAAYTLLEKAYKDVLILCTDTRDSDLVSSQNVSTRFIAVALLSHLQNCRVQVSPDQTAEPIDIYDQAISHLAVQAHRRPQRRVFADVRRCDMRIQALRATVSDQHSALQWLNDAVLHGRRAPPHKYRRHADGGGGQQPLPATRTHLATPEARYLAGQQWRLRQRDADLAALDEKSWRLKEDIRQSVEILDEEHGRAIRVFTVVTLVYLPLSYVTSFFGMNTADVRDTAHSQAAYWAAAIPLTAATLAMAFVYGYYSHEVHDWFTSRVLGRPAGRAESTEVHEEGGPLSGVAFPAPGRQVTVGMLSLMKAELDDQAESGRGRLLAQLNLWGRLNRAENQKRPTETSGNQTLV